MPHLRSILLTTSFLALAGAAQAQTGPDAGQDEPTQVEEIVITGVPYGVTRRATTLALEVLDEEALATAPPATLGDVVNGLPGVRSTSFAAGASRPVIRGLAGPRVLVLTNGVGLIDASSLSPDHQVAADPGDATRIEILRGPSTLAYGGTAIGGVVNVIDNRIPDEVPEGGLEGRVSAQGTSVDDGWAVGASLAAGAGPFIFTLEGQRREADDYDIPVPAESRRQLEAEGEEVESLSGTTLENSFSNLSTYGAGVSWIGGNGFLGVAVRRTESDYGVPGHAHHHHEEDEDHDDAPLFAAHAADEEEEEVVTIDLVQTRYDLRHPVVDGPHRRLRPGEHRLHERRIVAGARVRGEGFVRHQIGVAVAQPMFGLQPGHQPPVLRLTAGPGQRHPLVQRFAGLGCQIGDHCGRFGLRVSHGSSPGSERY